MSSENFHLQNKCGLALGHFTCLTVLQSGLLISQNTFVVLYFICVDCVLTTQFKKEYLSKRDTCYQESRKEWQSLKSAADF